MQPKNDSLQQNYGTDFSSDCDATVRSFLTPRWQAVIIYMYYYDLFWKIWFLKVNVLTSNDLSLQCIGTESVYYAMHGLMLRVIKMIAKPFIETEPLYYYYYMV